MEKPSAAVGITNDKSTRLSMNLTKRLLLLASTQASGMPKSKFISVTIRPMEKENRIVFMIMGLAKILKPVKFLDVNRRLKNN
jgi:hypothetical protein